MKRSSFGLGASVCLSALLTIFVSVSAPAQDSKAPVDIDKVEAELQIVKAAMEQPGQPSQALMNKYDWLINAMMSCAPAADVAENRAMPLLAPANTLCINGALAVADPDYNRTLASSTGTGVGNGVVGNCSLSSTATAANYDVYRFSVTGCTAFPTEITATLCGSAGCQHVGNVDTMLILYRRVAAGDALTANGGIGTAFTPSSPCTNAVAASDDLGTTTGTPNNPGGATCNQVATTQCVGPCTSPSNAGGLSGFRRQLGNGAFTLVVAGFGNTTVGSYNLSVTANDPGCVVSQLTPTAAETPIAGQVKNAAGRPIANATITLIGDDPSAPVIARTNPMGYYTLPSQSAGGNYILSISAKGYTFANPTILLTPTSDSSNMNFTSVE